MSGLGVFLVSAMSQHSFRTVAVAVATVAVVGIVGLAALHLAAHSRASTSTATGGGKGDRRHAAALSVPSPTASSTPAPSANPTASPGAGKSAPPSPPPSSGGKYPYPMDAGGNVVTGTLTLSPSQVAPGAAATITVSTSQSGWLAGQEIYVYLGHQYQLTITAPGSSASLTVAAGSVSSSGVVVSGFQFPNNNPAAPIDGYGTATLGAS